MVDILRFFRFPGDDTQHPQSWIEADLTDLDVLGWGGTAVLSPHPLFTKTLSFRIEALTIDNVSEVEKAR